MKNEKVKIFKDSVHGYINIPISYVQLLIDTKYFQRLRNIEQTGMRVLYPAAKHDRFSHSLGVFHLGQKAIEALRTDVGNDIFEKKEFDRYEVLFLIACILHDIGHTPFSHSLEDQVLNNSFVTKHQKGKRPTSDIKKSIEECLIELINGKESIYCNSKNIFQIEVKEVKAAPHEKLGAYLIFDKFEEAIAKLEERYEIMEDDVVLEDDLCFITRMIMGVRYEEFSPERQVRNCFIELLNGDNFDVDKLDYIVRDTQMSGINNVSVDVERLLGSLCIVTKTKYLDKVDMTKSCINNLTISKIANNINGVFEIEGNFKGILKINKGATVEIKEKSIIEEFKGAEQELAEIAYTTNDQAVFSTNANLRQDNEWVNAQEMSGYDTKVILLTGEPNNKKFGVYIKNAEVIKNFKIEIKKDIEIHILGECSISIKGQFESIGSLKLFSCRTLVGSISEVEILGNTFKKDFTYSKTASEHGYNTYSIGFKKQAISVIANVLEARNYLYLWVYAHHKVIYYANFLIPVITKEIAQFCGKDKGIFPLWKLNYDDLDKIDDYYIWTTIKYLHSENNATKLKKDYDDLVEQLFSRKYNRSLYKSLAEFELVYDAFTIKQKSDALKTLQLKTDPAKPFLGKKMGKEYFAGYLKNSAVKEINDIVNTVWGKTNEINISQIVYVVTEFKQKMLNPNNVYLDMMDEVLPISQIPILSKNHIANMGSKGKYFYLYYKEESGNTTPEKTRCIKEAIRKYFLDKN